MLYLITRSETYYPTPGTGDWVGMTPDPVEALRLYDAEQGRGQHVTLISIDPSTCTFAERRRQDIAAEVQQRACRREALRQLTRMSEELPGGYR